MRINPYCAAFAFVLSTSSILSSRANNPAALSAPVEQAWREWIRQCGVDDPQSIALQRIYTQKWPQIYVKGKTIFIDQEWWLSLSDQA